MFGRTEYADDLPQYKLDLSFDVKSAFTWGDVKILVGFSWPE